MKQKLKIPLRYNDNAATQKAMKMQQTDNKKQCNENPDENRFYVTLQIELYTIIKVPHFKDAHF